jgi:hypothetical protein
MGLEVHTRNKAHLCRKAQCAGQENLTTVRAAFLAYKHHKNLNSLIKQHTNNTRASCINLATSTCQWLWMFKTSHLSRASNGELNELASKTR